MTDSCPYVFQRTLPFQLTWNLQDTRTFLEKTMSFLVARFARCAITASSIPFSFPVGTSSRARHARLPWRNVRCAMTRYSELREFTMDEVIYICPCQKFRIDFWGNLFLDVLETGPQNIREKVKYNNVSISEQTDEL